jgi:hypothetical protein
MLGESKKNQVKVIPRLAEGYSVSNTRYQAVWENG